MIRPHFQRRRFFRSRRRGKVWSVVRRYQLLELFVLTGGIALVWLGSYLVNLSRPSNQIPAIESARINPSNGV
jgi:hypothetical protein